MHAYSAGCDDDINQNFPNELAIFVLQQYKNNAFQIPKLLNLEIKYHSIVSKGDFALDY